MKKWFLILLLFGIVFSISTPIFASEVNPPSSNGELISIDSVGKVTHEEFKTKINNMAFSFWQVSVDLIIPFTIIVLIAGSILGIFFQSARKTIIWAICAFVLVCWSPILVGLLKQWIEM